MLTDVYWIFLDQVAEESNGTELEHSLEKFTALFETVDILPSTHVEIALFWTRWQLYDCWKPFRSAEVKFAEICYRNRDLTEVETMKRALRLVDFRSAERRNLEAFSMPVGIGMAKTELLQDWNEVVENIDDLVERANYPFIENLMYDLNFTRNAIQLEKGGCRVNGSFSSGSVLMEFGQKAVEFCAGAVLMTPERMKMLDFTIVTLTINARFVFKQPPLSLVTNIFELPFSFGVWLSCFGFIGVYWIGLLILRSITKTEHLTPLESLMYIVGTLCQQNLELYPKYDGAKILLFWVQLANFFLFTSYSACIVALLQSPSTIIKSLTDLVESPLEVGAQNAQYAYQYLNESSDLAVQSVFLQKIKPLGKEAFADAQTGMKRVKNDMFAFQIEENTAHRIIMETFTPQDTCKVHELDSIKLPPFSIPLSKGSKYRELIRQRLLWQKEVGIVRRYNVLWIAPKPRCESGAAEFTSVGMNELRSAYIWMLVGFGIAFVLLAIEFTAAHCFRARCKKFTSVALKEGKENDLSTLIN
ncbi:uncharacterized protein LOC129752578 [Uranotaenia lowii]|uniref:uncharacterized protein LOC129752578 n=1 Tax=Uranotaenia lowii TaxID=190385 RepID=UPI002479C551|nr:uncharacterized protein LOC129752578 [Uranotaenia lowii]